MLCRLVCLASIFFMCLSTLIERASAAPDSKIAITDIAKVDQDFAFQGEYVGHSVVPGYGYVATGLQVVARGDGNFDAVRYVGGLPGAGWIGQDRLEMSGMREASTLTLEGQGTRIISDGQQATVFDENGIDIGTLVKTHRESPTLGAAPPAGAIVLFDGSITEHLNGASVTDDGLLEVGATTAMPVRDFRLHLEFRLPYMPYATGQGRANSGVYIQRRYECQILDSFGLEGVANECGGLYRQIPPDLNMCFPPLSWQTYDIWFSAARFDDEGNKTANARISVLHNNVAIHWNREIPTKTGAGQPESAEPLPILFQNHGNPVHFRNIWMIEDVGVPQPEVTYVRTQRCVRFPRLQCLLHRFRRCR